jgi:O-antigen biosynthesis protein
MRWRESYPGRVWTAIAKHGLSSGLQDSFARWSKERMRLVPDIVGEYDWVLNPNRPATLPPPSSGPLRIVWLIPSIEKASGGHLGIMRAIHHLEGWGHQNRIYVVGRTRVSPAKATAIARSFFPIKAEVELFDGKTVDSDALVATLWKTAYVARGIGNTARKFYFVQDLEHLFFAPGALSELAKETYRWGFYGITLGHWIQNVLQDEFKMECSAYGFCYNRNDYHSTGEHRLSARRKRVLFYARPQTERRAFELGILALSLVAKKMPDTEFVMIGCRLQPSQLPFPAILPGVVPLSQLGSWYRSCTAALVLSYTNLSLLPLELMACGCPVVSNRGANVESLLADDLAQLADSTPESLARAIEELLENEDLRARKARAAVSFAERINELSEMRRLEASFYRGLNIPAPPASPANALADPPLFLPQT